jgi:hypothetical protein
VWNLLRITSTAQKSDEKNIVTMVPICAFVMILSTAARNFFQELMFLCMLNSDKTIFRPETAFCPAAICAGAGSCGTY